MIIVNKTDSPGMDDVKSDLKKMSEDVLQN
jgi:hypothetical protein